MYTLYFILKITIIIKKVIIKKYIITKIKSILISKNDFYIKKLYRQIRLFSYPLYSFILKSITNFYFLPHSLADPFSISIP